MICSYSLVYDQVYFRAKSPYDHQTNNLTCCYGSLDAVLAQVEAEKRLALISAWEESEKSRAESK